MSEQFKGVINVDIKESVPDWGPYTQPIAPEGAPNVLYIVLDDVGFSAMEPFGGLDRDAEHQPASPSAASRYTNFHTTALCSPTRSCLLTGRNHTTNGMAVITEASSGFPNANGHIPFECATLAEVLGERGWNTYAVGKWHLTAEDEMNLASRKTPVAARAAASSASTASSAARRTSGIRTSCYDNHPVDAAVDARGGLPLRRRHHRQGARVHPRREGDRARQAVLPLLLPRRRHAPAPRAEGVERQVQGQLRHGLRGVSARSSSSGRSRWAIVPDKRRAVADQPVHRREERRRRRLAGARHGAPVGLALRGRAAAVRADGRGVRRVPQPHRPRDRPAARLPRGDAASSTTRSSCSSPTTAPRARAARTARSTRTSSSTACPTRSRRTCSTSTCSAARRRTTTTRPAGRSRSTRRSSCGSATGNSEGGTADPLIVSWPSADRRSTARCAGSTSTRSTSCRRCTSASASSLPEVVKGYDAAPARGRELRGVVRATRTRRPASRRSSTRCSGRAAIWHKGWKAATAVCRPAPERWLPNFATAALGAVRHRERPERMPRPRRRSIPEKLAGADDALVGRGRALPGAAARDPHRDRDPRRPRARSSPKPRNRYVYYPGGAEIPESVAPNIRNRSYTIAVELDVDTEEASGVLFAQGRGSAATRSTSRTASSSTSTTSSASREQIVESSEPVPTRTRRRSPPRSSGEGDAMPAEGTLSLHIRDQAGRRGPDQDPARQVLARRRGARSSARDGGEPVTDDYPGEAPWPFAGGTIHKAIIDVSGEPFVDLAEEARMAFARD